MRRHLSSRARAVALALLCAATVAPATTAAARTYQGPPCPNVRTFGHWTELNYPQFPANGAADQRKRAITDYTVDPQVPGRLFVTDGSTVLRSTSYGCGWKTVYQAPPTNISNGAYVTVERILAAGGNRVYLVVSTYLGAVQQLYASSDGGATFHEADSGLPPTGTSEYRQNISSPLADPKRVYFWIRGWYTNVLGVTKDGGASWTVLPAATSAVTDATNPGVMADPQSPDTVYIWTPTGLWRSTDAGQTFTKIGANVKIASPSTTTGAPPLAVIHPAGGGTQLLYSDGAQMWQCNADCSLQGAPTNSGPAGTSGITVPAHGRSFAYVWCSSPATAKTPCGRLNKWNWVTGTVTPIPLFGSTDEIQADNGRTPTVYVRSNVNLFRYRG